MLRWSNVSYKYIIFKINVLKIAFSFDDTLFIYSSKLSTIYTLDFDGIPYKEDRGERSRWNNYGINNNERRFYGGGTNAVGGEEREKKRKCLGKVAYI